MNKKETFTEEATRLIKEETEALGWELRQEAISEALSSRGEPLEVTASDVKKARERFVRRKPAMMPMTTLLLRIYVIGGALVFIGGISYPYIRKIILESDQVNRIAFMIAISGLGVSLMSLFMGRYLYAIRSSRLRHHLKTNGKTSSEMKG